MVAGEQQVGLVVGVDEVAAGVAGGGDGAQPPVGPVGVDGDLRAVVEPLVGILVVRCRSLGPEVGEVVGQRTRSGAAQLMQVSVDRRDGRVEDGGQARLLAAAEGDGDAQLAAERDRHLRLHRRAVRVERRGHAVVARRGGDEGA